MSSINYIEFKRFADSKLNILREEKTSTFAKYVMNNFGKLNESIDRETILNLGKSVDINDTDYTILKDAVYSGITYDYCIYNKFTFMGISKDARILFISDFDNNLLEAGKIYKE